MNLRELTEGFADGFKRGYGKPIVKSEPKSSATAFNAIDPLETKKILAAVIKGQQLDQRQLMLLKRVYNQL